MVLTNVFVNDNQPPHDTLIQSGTGEYSDQNATLAVKAFTVRQGLPIKGERYFIGSDQKRLDGTVHEVNAALVFFRDVQPR